MKIIFASSNLGKWKEVNGFLPSSIQLELAPQQLNVEETGKTFQENAFIKAKAYYDHYQLPTLADDSGLNLKAFPEILGVQSARYMEGKSYAQKCEEILKLYQNEPNREAFFTSSFCLYLRPESVFFFEGVMDGKIGTKLAGNEGFGYDPIFIPAGTTGTLAELTAWKLENSHRRKAINKINLFLSQQSHRQV
jgi:XTP/dITP diphosphohydrolase